MPPRSSGSLKLKLDPFPTQQRTTRSPSGHVCGTPPQRARVKADPRGLVSANRARPRARGRGFYATSACPSPQ
eukprot:8908466-Alexandrium_andersonii.AAC.1